MLLLGRLSQQVFVFLSVRNISCQEMDGLLWSWTSRQWNFKVLPDHTQCFNSGFDMFRPDGTGVIFSGSGNVGPKWYRLSKCVAQIGDFSAKKALFVWRGFLAKKTLTPQGAGTSLQEPRFIWIFLNHAVLFGRFLDLGFGSLEDDSSLTCTLIPMPVLTMVQRESLGPECPGDPHGVSSLGPDFYLIDDRPLSIEVQLIFWKSWGRFPG